MLTPILLLCLNSGVGCGPPSDAPSLGRDTVRIVPPSSAAADGERRDLAAGALELNPLPVVFGKFGGNIEFALAPHQALIVSPAYFSFGNYFYGPEAELGYRFYVYDRPLTGPFLGFGAMGAAFQYHPDSSCGSAVGSCSRQDQATYLYGLTFETGWQWVLRSRVLLGVGAGVIVQHAAPRERQLYQSDLTNIAELVLDSGVHPRGLFTVGYAF